MELPNRLEEWLSAEKPVRRSMDDYLAGLCGAEVLRSRGSENGGKYCTRGAGVGTDHKTVGRCWQHEDTPLRDGIPPWVGEIPDDDWRQMTGGREVPGEMTHGIGQIEQARKTFEEQMLDALPESDQQVYESITVDPVTIIDMDIKLNRTMAVRVMRFITRRMHQLDLEDGIGANGRADPQIRDAEATVIKLSQVLARLLEVRVRYSELAEEQNRDDFLAELLAKLPAEDFRQVSENPEYLEKFLSRERTNF